MKKGLNEKTLGRWTQQFSAKGPLALKHLAIYFGMSGKNVIAHIFSNLDQEDCRAKLVKFFFIQKVVDLKEDDFACEAMKKRLDEIFLQAEQHYQKVEAELQAKQTKVKKKIAAQSEIVPIDEEEMLYLEVLKKAGLEPFVPKPVEIQHYEAPPYYYVNRGIRKEAA